MNPLLTAVAFVAVAGALGSLNQYPPGAGMHLLRVAACGVAFALVYNRWARERREYQERRDQPQRKL